MLIISAAVLAGQVDVQDQSSESTNSGVVTRWDPRSSPKRSSAHWVGSWSLSQKRISWPINERPSKVSLAELKKHCYGLDLKMSHPKFMCPWKSFMHPWIHPWMSLGPEYTVRKWGLAEVSLGMWLRGLYSYPWVFPFLLLLPGYHGLRSIFLPCLSVTLFLPWTTNHELNSLKVMSQKKLEFWVSGVWSQ